MADHYVALSGRGITGEKYSDFIISTASTAGTNQIELRVQDGANWSRKDVKLALKAFERFFENNIQMKSSGFPIDL